MGVWDEEEEEEEEEEGRRETLGKEEAAPVARRGEEGVLAVVVVVDASGRVDAVVGGGVAEPTAGARADNGEDEGVEKGAPLGVRDKEEEEE